MRISELIDYLVKTKINYGDLEVFHTVINDDGYEVVDILRLDDFIIHNSTLEILAE